MNVLSGVNKWMVDDFEDDDGYHKKTKKNKKQKGKKPRKMKQSEYRKKAGKKKW